VYERPSAAGPDRCRRAEVATGPRKYLCRPVEAVTVPDDCSATRSLRAGLTHAAAVDTAWAVASPETHQQLVRQAGYDYDQLEGWVRATLSAALLRGD
jgi:hypothetical protein